MSTTVGGIPGSFTTGDAAKQVTFPVPHPPFPEPVAGIFHHNQGQFHLKGAVSFSYHNTTAGNEHIDWVYVAIGYNSIIHTDDYEVWQVPCVLTVPAGGSGTFSAPFDAFKTGNNEPLGKDPAIDLFCGPGAFYVGLLGGASDWSTDSLSTFPISGRMPLLQATGFSVQFDVVEFIYDVVTGSEVCGATGPCPVCGGPVDVPTGHPFGFTEVCATEMTGVAPTPTWTVTGPGLVNVTSDNPQDWVVSLLACNIFVEAPCQDYPPGLIGQSAGVYTVVVSDGTNGWTGSFNLIYAVRCTPVAGTGPLPPGSDGGVDLLYWREGYHIVMASSSGMGLKTKWHWDSTTDEFSVTVDAGDCGCPKLSHPATRPPLGVVYARGTGADRAIYRQESYDYGKTWVKDPPGGGPFMTGPNGVSFAAEVWNGRTQERIDFYNDASDKDSDGKATGKGVIFCDVYGPHVGDDGLLVKDPKGPFRVTPTGELADGTSFGAIFVRHAGAVDCSVFVAGAENVYRSHDDGRTWKLLSSARSPSVAAVGGSGFLGRRFLLMGAGSPGVPSGKGAFEVEVWNERTNERVNFHNDNSNVGTDGKPTGKGAIMCNVYGPQIDDNGLMVKDPAGPFRVTPAGALADATSFGAIYVRQSGAIDVAAFVASAEIVYRSHDDGRTWGPAN